MEVQTTPARRIGEGKAQFSGLSEDCRVLVPSVTYSVAQLF